MAVTHKFTAFGKNDIRGIYEEDVTEELFYYVGKAYIKYLVKQSGQKAKDIWVSTVRDARLHSPSLSKALIKGVTHMGANVVDMGLAPTPMGYYSEFAGIPSTITNKQKIMGSLIVTASHNPKEYNGLKMTYNKASITENGIKEIKELTIDQISTDETAPRFGLTRKFDIIPEYIDSMTKQFPEIGKGIKVVVDSANATGGLVAPKLYNEYGCEVIELFSEPDGNFPNHHPNPSDEKTLEAIKAKVVETNADLGIAFDGDSDRVGVIDSKGNYLTGDKLLLIYALDVIKDLVKRGEKPAIVSEVKCSQVLYDTINNNGANAIMCKTGHGYIKDKMKETKAILAGEMSGHMFFKDRYYGFDDAIYGGSRIIEIVAKNKMQNPDFKLEDLLEPFTKVFTSTEVRYPCQNELKATVLKLLTKKIEDNKDVFGAPIKDIITLDGLRIVFADGFALIRQSNTEPVFTLRFEAKNKKQAEQYKKAMISMLEKCIKDCQ
ncbi:MAG: phosphomannomutase/phosphoglucomutase [Candidatus Gastranaerophilales bacterium]|nr:phosphomannomutase/phosphoglucomutase [Candidatus Gastranaerophilales bacterium]